MEVKHSEIAKKKLLEYRYLKQEIAQIDAEVADLFAINADRKLIVNLHLQIK